MKLAIRTAAALALLLIWAGPVKAGFINGSFETGDFRGWITHDLTNPFVPLTVRGAGYSPGFGLFSSAPTDGQYAATTGFDGIDPGHITLAQEIVIGPGTSTISFDYRAGWDMKDFSGSSAARLFDVEILTVGGASVLLDQNFITAQPGTEYLDTGPLTGSVDVSKFAGTVRVQFDWYVPQDHTGPAFSQLDNIQLHNTPPATVPEPSGFALFSMAVSLVAYCGWRRRSRLPHHAHISLASSTP